MNTSAEQPWSRAPEHMDTMAMSSELEDLGNLFEFGDLDLSNIPSVDSTHYAGHLQQQQPPAESHPNTPFEEINESRALAGTSAQDFGVHTTFDLAQSAEQAHKQRLYQARTQVFTSEPMYENSMQSYQANPQYSFPGLPGFPSSQHVPPTPNSYGMHGETAPFMLQQPQMDPQQRAILEQRYQLRKEDAIAFTPMVSPAGTPQYNVQPEFTIPGAYFSPLTSPMLHAQPGQNSQHHQGYYTNPSTAPTSNATSPLDPSVDVDMLGDEVNLGEPANSQSKKPGRRKAQTPRSAGPLARVKQSPIQKAAKRKSGSMLSSMAPTLEMEAISSRRSDGEQPCTGALQLQLNESSENGSISPEPLSEALMGPPPRPGSNSIQSPATPGQRKDTPTSQPGKAATPKSLLSMRGAKAPGSGPSSQQGRNGGDDEMELEELELPAAAAGSTATPPSMPQLNTQTQEHSPTDDTPRISARRTPKLGPGSTPFSRSTSAVVSPSIAGSPMLATTPGTLLKDKKSSDGKGERSNKKRGSVSGNGSTLVSPALRPRISPSIKPLLPEGASLHSPTHALLLASKSNYQNLLEGNHLPGVNYPDSLSTGLTSKRTSHKVAEQGRRNRINEALKEMQSLLPKSAVVKSPRENSDDSPEAEGDSKDSKEDAQVKSNSSKAATVESANEYIRKLQKRLLEQESALKERDAVRKENEDLRRKLEQRSPTAASTDHSSSPAPSPAA